MVYQSKWCVHQRLNSIIELDGKFQRHDEIMDQNNSGVPKEVEEDIHRVKNLRDV